MRMMESYFLKVLTFSLCTIGGYILWTMGINSMYRIRIKSYDVTDKGTGHNICFIKTHKCASSTITNIMQRYGLKNNLTFALPLKNNVYFGFLRDFREDSVAPLPPGKQANMLVNHAIFNEPGMKHILGQDVKFIGVLRYPLKHLKSVYNYFRLEQKYLMPSIDTFLSDPKKYDVETERCSYTHNFQAFHYGFNMLKSDSKNYIKHRTLYLDRIFTLMIIVEHFDESMILLKRALNWKLWDVVYMSKKVREYNEKNREITEEKEAVFKKWNNIDYFLYDHFNKTLWHRVKLQGTGFKKELDIFKSILQEVTSFCSSDIISGELKLVDTYNNQTQTWTAEDCVSLKRDPKDFTQTIRKKQYGGLFKHRFPSKYPAKKTASHMGRKIIGDWAVSGF
ncbi:unnamed protein product [Owenia fusiformis]|uniref:Uncharacterized protein n=1 Tax=Owenia fusiformis TaxID=6347 RepID=A0A8J1UHI0_OWEFU|nr:unnamed protein product [Owenia fusiformis]